MKTSRMTRVVIVGCLLALVGLLGLEITQAQSSGAAATGASRVAVCDVAKVFQNYQKAKDLTSQLNERKQALQMENDKRGKAIEAIEMEVSGLKVGSKEYEQRMSEIQRLTIERRAWLEFQNALVLREHHRLTKEMYDEISQTIEKLSKDRGIQLVFFRIDEMGETQNTQELLQQIERRRVLYAADSADLTDAVLVKLNEQYRGATK